MSDISSYLIDNNSNISLLSDNNFANANINIDTNVNTNFDKTMTNKYNNNFYQNILKINFKDLF